MPDQEITTEWAAIEKARQITGFDDETASATAERLQIAASGLPFLANQVIGQAAWRVQFSKLRLKLKSTARGFRDQYEREFEVILLERGARILSVTCRYEGEAPDMRDPPSAESAENQMRDAEEVYTGFPAVDPKLNFLDALDAVLTKGSGSPLLAKSIEGFYVMDSTSDAPARAVWAITLRGLPPFSAHGPYADSVPVWQRNHMRNVVDAMTGELLFATNSPQPI